MGTPVVTTYGLDEVTCTVGGKIVDGLGENGSYEFTMADAVFKATAGVDGHVCFWKTQNQMCNGKITLLQDSSCNDVFSAVLAVAAKAPNGAGIVPFFLVDRSGRTLIKAPYSLIMGYPSVTLSNGVSNRVWDIVLVKPAIFVGGNN